MYFRRVMFRSGKELGGSETRFCCRNRIASEKQAITVALELIVLVSLLIIHTQPNFTKIKMPLFESDILFTLIQQ